EEDAKDIIRNVAGFGWDYEKLIRQDKLRFVDAVSPEDITMEIGQSYDFMPLILRVEHAMKSVRAKRLVLDNLNAFFMRFSNKNEIRAVLNFLLNELKKRGATVLISVEKDGPETARAFISAEFVSDAIVMLSARPGQQRTLRELEIRKIRGAGYRSGQVEFEITRDGLQVFPKIPVNLTAAATDFTVLKKIGVPAFDDGILAGGIPQGQTVVISGNTGTGKTIIGLQFIQAGLREGEHGLYVGLEENTDELKYVARGLGWDMARDEKQGKMAFLTASLIDLQKDRLLWSIIRAVERYDVKRLVFDSISSLMSAANMSISQARDFVIQLGGYLKMKGITSIFTYMMPQNFGAPPGLLLSSVELTHIRVSSLVDGLVLLVFVERERKVEMALTVLKMRGVHHSKDVFAYKIDKGGLKIEGVYGKLGKGR
ncbi:MAG: ATPase domain-containing protein, partial [Deltaproteobacteria bacterium]